MFARAGGRLLSRDNAKLGWRWREAETGCLRLFQRIIQLPGLVDVAGLKFLERVGLGLLAFRRRMVAPPLTLQEPVVNNCGADVLSELRSIRRFVGRNQSSHFADDSCGHSELGGQRVSIQARNPSQPIEVSLERGANLDPVFVGNRDGGQLRLARKRLVALHLPALRGIGWCMVRNTLGAWLLGRDSIGRQHRTQAMCGERTNHNTMDGPPANVHALLQRPARGSWPRLSRSEERRVG